MRLNCYFHTLSFRLMMRLCALLLLLMGSTMAKAQSVTFTTPTTILAGDSSYEGYDVIVSGTWVTINGTHSFNSLKIINNGNVTHDEVANDNYAGGLLLSITTNLFIQAGSSINVDGKGFGSGSGPGAGVDRVNDRGSGGSYGGMGSTGSTVYGDIKNPIDMGSGENLGSGGGAGGAGAVLGGNGGGCVQLTVKGTLQVEGAIYARGQDRENAGAGSGGSILLKVGILKGKGGIYATGGGTGWDNSAGGGGRIAIYYSTKTGVSLFAGGGGGWHNAGGAGTIFTKQSSQANGDLLIDNAGIRGGDWTPLLKEESFDNVQVSGRAIFGAIPLTVFTLNVSGNMSIGSGSQITADGQGFGSGSGPGAGINRISLPGTGGSFGGMGGTGTRAYGDIRYPIDMGNGENFGSGGGSGYAGTYPGGIGGGAILLNVAGSLQVDGIISANGRDGHGSGGGSGGSVIIKTTVLKGSGTINALGGNGDGWRTANAGSGGRVAVYFTKKTGVSLFAGGGATDGSSWGGAGTIFTKQSSQANGDLLVDNGGATAINGTPLLKSETFDNVRVRNGAVLGTTSLSVLSLQVLGNMVVEKGAAVGVDGMGYDQGAGPGAGQNDTTGDHSGGGGGYGGVGQSVRIDDFTSNAGGATYGSAVLPTDFGSGSGFSYLGRYIGYPGGGAMSLDVKGVLQVDGALTAQGWGYNNIESGASGGSILLRAGTFTGLGVVNASGAPSFYGGGGGGGRIALYYVAKNSFSGVWAVNGYAKGTVYIEQITGLTVASVTTSTNVTAVGLVPIGTVTLSMPAPDGGAKVALFSSNTQYATVPVSVLVPAGKKSADFVITPQSTTLPVSVVISGALGGIEAKANITVNPWLSSISYSPPSLVGGDKSIGSVTLTLPAPSKGLRVSLSSSDASVTVPAVIVVPPGSLTKTFAITSSAVSASRTVFVTATFQLESVNAPLFLAPSSAALSKVSLSPNSILGGANSIGTVTLVGKAPAGGVIVSITSDDYTLATPPISVTVPEGKSSASFVISTAEVSAQKAVVISARLGSATRKATLLLNPIGVASLALVPDTVTGGEASSQGIVTLARASNFDTIVTLSSNNGLAIPPTQIVIPAGQVIGVFDIDTLPNTSGTPVTALISARANGVTVSAKLKIN